MPPARLQPLNLFFTFLIAYVLSGLQTTFWYQIFGDLPVPQVWLLIVLYVLLYRTPWWSWIEVYALALVFAAFTSTPLGILWMKFFAVCLLVTFVKNRIFWTGPRYFLIASFGVTFSYQVISLLVSQIFEDNPAPIEVLNFLANMIVTPLFALAIYWLMSMIDSYTRKDPTLDSHRGAEL